MRRLIRYLRRAVRFIINVPRLIWVVINLYISRISNNNKKQSIGLLVDSFGRGGLEQVVLNLYKGYREKGYDTYIISVTNQVEDSIQGIEDDPRHIRILHWSVIDLIKFCSKNNIRTLHYHYSIYHIPLMRLLGIKTIYTIHNTYVWFNKVAWIRTKVNLFFASHIVAVSDFAKDYFQSKTNIRRVKTILNGINTEHFISSDYTSPMTRKSIGIKDSDIVFVNVASFNEQKYQMSLVGVMESMVKQRDDVKMILAGPIGDRKLFNSIVRTINKSPAKDKIIIIDAISQVNLPSFLKTIPDVFILPSVYEAGVPLVVSEAIMCNLPVIMTDLNVKNFPLSSYITTIKPHYQKLSDVSIDEVKSMVKKKRSSNHDDMLEKMLSTANNLPNLKKRYPVDNKLLSKLSILNMTKAYIKLIE